ncbi:M56 family metallopeptidase [Lacrimispora sp.]|uniref:M56 family metallopeptidase n=1 Tax=Lacrimispora sp. TaxID=2719234 RepID=UPI0028A5F33F|nr:M56 family metallopeptidase [Lacrimispora sp.]
MERIFLTVLNMSLTASFVIAAIILARIPLKRAPKIISYALWAVAGFRLVFPFTLEGAFSLLPFNSTPIPQDIAVQAVPRIDSGITVIDKAVSAALPAAAPVTSINPLQIWIFIGTCIWLFGIAFMLIYSFVSIVVLKRRLRSATLMEGNLYEAKNLKTPLVIGIFKPKIYIPAGLTDEEHCFIVLHERTHIRRHDHAVKMFAYLVLCLHWFNPLAWAAFVLMGADMEMSCDECVIRRLGGEIKSAYSLSLVRVASGRKILNGSPLAFGEGGMKERIKNVLNFKKPSGVIITLAIVLVTVMSAGFAVNRTADGSILDLIIPMSMHNIAKEPHFAGMVTEVYDNSILVIVDEGEEVRRNSDLISVSLNVKLKDSITHFNVGDRVIVYYNGEIAESYPAQINTVYAIVLTSPDMRIIMDDIYALSAMRTPYVGNNSAVGKIIGELPGIDREYTQQFFSIGDDYRTGRAPYTLTIYYEPNDSETSAIKNITVTPKNSALLFMLIDNLEEVNIAFRETPSDGELHKEEYTSRATFSKEDISEYLDSIGLGWEDFQNNWNLSIEKMFSESASDFTGSGTMPVMVTEPNIVDGSVIRIVDFEIGDSCSLYIEVLAPKGNMVENSGETTYEVVSNTKLILPADVLVSYIDYESSTGTNGKKLISYLNQGGSYFNEPTIAKLIVHTDESGNNITELTEVYETL